MRSFESNLEQMLSSHRQQYGFTWMMLIGSDGLALSQSGIAEQFEVSALLPSWVSSGYDIARAAHLEHGMGFVCLVPRRGEHLLLIQDFSHNKQRFIVLVATPKLPKGTAGALRDICRDISNYL